MENKRTILIADDDEMFVKLMSNELSQADLQVFSVNNGQAVLDKALDIKPNLILTDMIMPIKDGFTVIKEIREHPELSKTKIIVFSSLGQEEDVTKAIKLGADGYLIKKDYSLSELVSKILELLK